jgi:hypothetical protein
MKLNDTIMTEIKIFLMVLSIVYSLKFVFQFVLKLTQETPEPIKVSKVEQTLLYFAVSYIITFFLI